MPDGDQLPRPLLREELLAGKRIVLAGEVPEPVRDALLGCGAELEILDPQALEADDERVGEWAHARAPLDALVYTAAARFGDGGAGALTATLEEAWTAVREVAIGALIPAANSGKLLLLAPPAGAGPFSEAARSGLENLARTLSVEWARYGLTAVMTAPGAETSWQQLGALVCFLVADAGGYLSGCRLELGSVP
jgi:NAD(P)-dependent dehydrogenase (short-subunit alcohol dehydrogenase family)